jgi:hypothetical protein
MGWPTKRRMKREQFIAGLRAVASFFEQHPELKTPSMTYTFNIVCHDPEALPIHAKVMGSCKKIQGLHFIGLQKDFGSVKLKFTWQKYDTCKRVEIKNEVEVIGYHTDYQRPITVKKYKWICPTSFINACCEE